MKPGLNKFASDVFRDQIVMQAVTEVPKAQIHGQKVGPSDWLNLFQFSQYISLENKVHFKLNWSLFSIYMCMNIIDIMQ